MMDERKTIGLIMFKDELGIEYKVCKITYVIREDDSFKYIFNPYYEVIDLIESKKFQGIPGLDLSLRLDEYIREDRVPVFISERTPGPNRVDLKEMLSKVGMDYLNRLEWLIRTDLRYFGDKLYVVRDEDKYIKEVITIDDKGMRAEKSILEILKFMAYGKDVIIKDVLLNGERRINEFKVLHYILEKDHERRLMDRKHGIGIEHGKNPVGRRKKDVDFIRFMEVREAYIRGKITANKAAEELKISRSTFLRRMKSELEI